MGRKLFHFSKYCLFNFPSCKNTKRTKKGARSRNHIEVLFSGWHSQDSSSTTITYSQRPCATIWYYAPAGRTLLYQLEFKKMFHSHLHRLIYWKQNFNWNALLHIMYSWQLKLVIIVIFFNKDLSHTLLYALFHKKKLLKTL